MRNNVNGHVCFVRKGFTLVELIVIMIILGILAAIIIPRFTSYFRNAAIETDIANARTIATAAATVYSKHPDTYAEIDIDDDSIKALLPKDWENESAVDSSKVFIVEVGSNGYIYVSCGGAAIYPNFSNYSAVAKTW